MSRYILEQLVCLTWCWLNHSLIDWLLIDYQYPPDYCPFLWFLDFISKSVWWIFFIFCICMHLDGIHLWYKGHVDWIIPSLINNQSIDWKFHQNFQYYLISQKLCDEFSSYQYIIGVHTRRPCMNSLEMIESSYQWSIINQLIEKCQNLAWPLILETGRRRAKRTKLWTPWDT
jgi:hypothetical protein